MTCILVYLYTCILVNSASSLEKSAKKALFVTCEAKIYTREDLKPHFLYNYGGVWVDLDCFLQLWTFKTPIILF